MNISSILLKCEILIIKCYLSIQTIEHHSRECLCYQLTTPQVSIIMIFNLLSKDQPGIL